MFDKLIKSAEALIADVQSGSLAAALREASKISASVADMLDGGQPDGGPPPMMACPPEEKEKLDRCCDAIAECEAECRDRAPVAVAGGPRATMAAVNPATILLILQSVRAMIDMIRQRTQPA